MAHGRRVLLGGLAWGGLCAPFLRRASAQNRTLQVWHDLGENGTKWFAEVATAFAAQEAGVLVRAVSYPTDQWFSRSIGALNTDTGPDLLFNNYERVIRVANQTGKIADLRPVLDSVADRGAYLSDDDLRVATYAGRMVILPVQRVQMAFGVRKSWLERANEPFPATWDDVRRVGAKFQQDGRQFALALQAAKPRDLVHMLDLFTFGAGLQHTLVDPQGQVVLDQPRHAQVLRDFLSTFASGSRLVAPDTINHSFGEMYQMIEGGRAGMFRVGDWNVAKWDGAATLKGDFAVGPWPAHFAGTPGKVVVGGMRGVAVPDNGKQVELATRFAAFLMSKPAQQASLRHVGAAVRKDLDTDGLSERQRLFAKPEWPLAAYDFPEASLPWYPELEAAFHRRLLAVIASPPADMASVVPQVAAEMRAQAKTLMEAKRG